MCVIDFCERCIWCWIFQRFHLISHCKRICISRKNSWHYHILREKIHDVRNSLRYCFCHKYFVTPIVFQCWSDTPSHYSIFAPCGMLSWFFMCVGFVPGSAMRLVLESDVPIFSHTPITLGLFLILLVNV